MLSLSTKEKKAKFNTNDLVFRKIQIYQAILILNTTLLNH